MEKVKFRKGLLCLLAGVLTGLCQMLGMILERMEQGKDMAVSALVASVLPSGILWMAGTAVVCALGYRFCRAVFVDGAGKTKKKKGSFWIFQAVIFVCWLPCYLAYFPAIYSYDGEPQLIQYTTHAFDNHQPILHTLFLGACYDFGQFLQTKLHLMLDGMAVYAFIQMLVLSASFAMGLSFLQRRGIKRTGLILLTAWFALFPVHPLMAVSTTKDTLYTAFLLLFIIGLLLFLTQTERKDWLVLTKIAAAALLMMLMRRNGVYLVAGTLAAGLIGLMICRGKKSIRWRRFGSLCVVLALSVLCFAAADAGLMKATGAKQGESAEALSIPIQQLARTYKSNQDSMTQTQLDELFYYIPREGLDNYRPYISDGVKQQFQNERFAEDPMGFLKLWAALGKEYPGSYATAFLYHTMGAWYPSDVSHTKIYQNWWRDRTGYFITDATPVFAGDFVKKENLLPGVRGLYEKIATDCVQLSFLPARILFATSTWCLMVIFFGMAALAGKRYQMLLPISTFLVNLACVLAGPCILVRYVYPFMAVLPFMTALLVQPEE